MTSVLERERAAVREREREERLPEIPPRRPRIVRWLEWTVFGLGVAIVIVAAVIAIANMQSDEATVPVTPDEAQSGLVLGPRHLDPNFVIPQRWVGDTLEGTTEDLEGTIVLEPRRTELGRLVDYPLRHMPPVERTALGPLVDYGPRHPPAGG